MTTRTVVGLVEATWDRVQLGGRLECTALLNQAAALDAEVTAMRARLAALDAFADEVRSAAHNDGETLAESNATIICALAKLPVKP